MNKNKENLSIEWADVQIDNNGNAIYLCPYTGLNTFDWYSPDDDYPDELIYYFINFVGEPTFIHPDFQNLLNEFYESDELNEEFEDFEEYLIHHLPEENQYQLIYVEHPDGATGDFATLIYKVS
jgi:hypothetical protein